MTPDERAEKIFSHIVNLLDLTMGEVREPLHTMVRDFIAAEIRQAVEEALDKMAWGELQKQAKAEAFEEAAKVAESISLEVVRSGEQYIAARCANAIRALKEKL